MVVDGKRQEVLPSDDGLHQPIRIEFSASDGSSLSLLVAEVYLLQQPLQLQQQLKRTSSTGPMMVEALAVGAAPVCAGGRRGFPSTDKMRAQN